MSPFLDIVYFTIYLEIAWGKGAIALHCEWVAGTSRLDTWDAWLVRGEPSPLICGGNAAISRGKRGMSGDIGTWRYGDMETSTDRTLTATFSCNLSKLGKGYKNKNVNFFFPKGGGGMKIKKKKKKKWSVNSALVKIALKLGFFDTRMVFFKF